MSLASRKLTAAEQNTDRAVNIHGQTVQQISGLDSYKGTKINLKAQATKDQGKAIKDEMHEKYGLQCKPGDGNAKSYSAEASANSPFYQWDYLLVEYGAKLASFKVLLTTL